MSTLSLLHHYILRHELLPDGAGVVVGVSGGPDSLALLHALGRLAPSHGWWLHAAYLHHGLRPEADAEARFVAEVAGAWGWGCTIERADVAQAAAQPGISLEEAARHLRYAFLGRVARNLGVDRIAVGHNADDQAETVLMHLLRGSGLAGLRGMQPATSLSQWHAPAIAPHAGISDILLVRPWLETSRQAILAYCEACGLQPRYDATNTDTTLYRNRLRHEVLPALVRINPNLIGVLGHTAAALQGDYDSLSVQREALWLAMAHVEGEMVSFHLPRLRALPRADQRALLRRAISALRPNLRTIHWEHTERLLDILPGPFDSGGPYPLVAGIEAWLNYERLDIAATGWAPSSSPQVRAEHEWMLPGMLDLNSGWRLTGRHVAWSPEDGAPWEANGGEDRIWLPPNITLPLIVRTRRSGDRMHPLGLGGSKAITDLMTELRVPRAARKDWPLLTTLEGKVLWLVGRRAGEGCRLAPEAASAWEIRLEQRGSAALGEVAAK